MKLKLALAGAVAAALTLLGAVSAQATSTQPASAATTTAATAAAQAAPVPALLPKATAAAGFVRLGGSPSEPAVDPATDTLYVPVQCAKNFCADNAPGHVVDVISTANCNAAHVSGCHVIATAKVGRQPYAIAIDQRSDTVYVMSGTSGPGVVSVLNGARCNAHVTSGCGKPAATFKVGNTPLGGVVNPATHTLYVANGGGGISVVNTAKCNAKVTSGCGARQETVPDNGAPSWAGVDVATDTVYVANSGDGSTPGSVSVINGAACNASTGTGCAKKPVTIRVGVNAFTLAVDQAADTVYVANYASGNGSGSVSVINGKTCHGGHTAGCKVAATVPTGSGTGQVGLDARLHTLFAVNAGDDTLSAIDTRACNGTATAGCARRPRNVQAAALRGPGFDSFAQTLVLDPEHGTVYVLNYGGLSVLSVDGTGRCNAVATAGCRAEAPRVADHDYLFAADPATHTIYAGNVGKPRIDVINSATCHAGHLSGCAPVATIPMPDPGANVGAIDQATHTLYAADESKSGTLAVINTATCNATHTAGCGKLVATIKIGAYPNPPVINPATHTVYVSYGNTATRIAVVNAATCNATDTAGCGHGHAAVKVGAGTDVLAVSVATNTVYGANSGNATGFSGDTVSVLNGASCEAGHTSGCGHLAATAKVGAGPDGIVVNDATHTVYVANNADGDGPGTVSVLNTASCDGTHTGGCHAKFPVMATGVAPTEVAFGQASGLLYVTDFNSAAVTVLSTARCNAGVTSGCGQAGRQQAVGSSPVGLVISGCSVYVGQVYGKGSMSIFRC